MKIYDINGVQLLDVAVGDDSHANKRIMDENVLILYYELPVYIEITGGAYVDFQGERYTLESPQNFKCQGDRNFQYTVTFEGSQAKLKKYMMRDTTIQNWLKFSYIGTPFQHATMLVENMNRRESGWSVGDVVEAPDATVSYNHTICMEALQMIADAFHTEWEVKGKVVHLRKVEYNKSVPVALSYGQGAGFVPGVGRENFGNDKPVEILFVQGGRRNIDASVYGATELLLPKSQIIAFDGSKFEDEEGFNSSTARTYVTDADGLSVMRSDKALVTNVERSVDLPDIYPKRVGTVTEVVVTTEGENTFYDIIDDTIPATLNYEDYLIAGETMTLIFQTGGILAGREFDVKYIHAERKFEIVPAELDGQTMPSASAMPVVGAKYAIFGCMLPAAYIRDDATKSGASWDLFREGVRYKYENEEVQYSFTGVLDEQFADNNWMAIGSKLVSGGYVQFTSDKFLDAGGVLIRITGVNTPVNHPHEPKIELSNVSSGGNLVSQLNKIEAKEVVNELRYENAMNFARRRFEDAKEAQEMLEKAFENFSPGIDPAWVRTMSVLIGNEYQQFEFVSNKTNTQVEVLPSFTINNATKIFSAPTAILKHMTMGIENTSSTHDASEYKYWDIAAYISPYLGDDSSP
jgi:hypothetical protein